MYNTILLITTADNVAKTVGRLYICCYYSLTVMQVMSLHRSVWASLICELGTTIVDTTSKPYLLVLHPIFQIK